MPSTFLRFLLVLVRAHRYLTGRLVAQLSDESRAYILVPRALDTQRAKPDEYSKAWDRHQEGGVTSMGLT